MESEKQFLGGGGQSQDAFGRLHRSGGSLPLKKRRFHEITSLHDNGIPVTAVVSKESIIPSQTHADSAICNSADEKIAALALVAAATASSTNSTSAVDFSNFTGNSFRNKMVVSERTEECDNHNNDFNHNQSNNDNHNRKDNHHSHNNDHTTSLVFMNKQSQEQSFSEMYSGQNIQSYHHPGSSGNFPSCTPSERLGDNLQTDNLQTDNLQTDNIHTDNLQTDNLQNPSTISSKTQTPKQRVNHPPLTSPMPGGCHGRTSRNNSFCRRTPCYNGSNYCKLHYQQYVVQRGASPHPISSSYDSAQQNMAKLDKHSINAKVNTDSPRSENTENSTYHRHHQDKRFSGLNHDEKQCLATTTRGRPCAYVAVHGTKYCNLHADYDTNPPPRRGGGGGGGGGGGNSGSNKSKINNQNDKDNATKSETMEAGQLILPIDATKLGYSSNVNENKNTQENTIDPTSSAHNFYHSVPLQKKVIGSTTAELSSCQPVILPINEDTHSDMNNIASLNISDLKDHNDTDSNITSTNCPYPLLNSIPSDNWHNKLVLISSGPLINHTGRVIKWGNGWITVSTVTGRIAGEGGCKLLHNRRAFELYLIPEDENLSQMEGNGIGPINPSEDEIEADAHRTLKTIRSLDNKSLKNTAENPLSHLYGVKGSLCTDVNNKIMSNPSSQHHNNPSSQKIIVNNSKSDSNLDSIILEPQHHIKIQNGHDQNNKNYLPSENLPTNHDMKSMQVKEERQGPAEHSTIAIKLSKQTVDV